MIPADILRALGILAEKIEPSETSWAITGSTSLALQGIDVIPNDIDVLTNETGAYRIARLFTDQVVSPTSFKKSEKYESHFGRLEIEGIRIEVMGNLRVFRGGRWLPIMTPETRKLVTVSVGGHNVPVVSIESQKESGYLEERLKKT